MSDGTHTECQETNSELELKRLRSERDHYRENVIPDLQAQLDQERQRREQAEGLLRECREPVHKHGWCLHHQADHLCEPYGHVRGDQLWGLVSDIDKHFGEWDE